MSESPNIFSRISDSRAVVQFVRDIEKYPCLYDQNSVEYSNRALKRKTWVQIAKNSNCTVAECKEKWRKIRIAYIRTLRPNYNTGHSGSRPYYLASYLKFISPFKKKKVPIKSNNHQSFTGNKNRLTGNKPAKVNHGNESGADKTDKEHNSNHPVFLEVGNGFEDDEFTDASNDCEVERKEGVLNEVTRINDVNTKEQSVCEKRKSCCESIECNPRKMFLLSLLPDLEAMNEHQMRKFRREVINLVDEIMCD